MARIEKKSTLTPADRSFAEDVFSVFMKGFADPDSEVRNSAVFGLGIIIANAGNLLQPKLFALLQAEKHDSVQDNIYATAIRIADQKPDEFPLEQLLPLLLQCLPLKEDFGENASVFQCLINLFSGSRPELIPHLPDLLKVIAGVLGTSQIIKDTENLLVQFVQNVHNSYPDALQKVKAVIEPDLRMKLDACNMIS